VPTHLYNELTELPSYCLVEFLKELETATLRILEKRVERESKKREDAEKV
jgi:hypothetical protein